MKTPHTQKRSSSALLLGGIILVVLVSISTYGAPKILGFLQSRTLSADSVNCLVDDTTQKARTILIGPDFHEGPNTCVSLNQLYARSPDFCVRPGDQILFQQGKTFFGRLKLRECNNAIGSGEVTIGTAIPAKIKKAKKQLLADNATQDSKNIILPTEAKKSTSTEDTKDKTFLVPAKQAQNFKIDGQPLKWERVTSTVTYNGKELPHLKDWFVYRMQIPEDIKIKQFYYNNWMLPVARHPNTSTVQTGGSAYFPYQAISPSEPPATGEPLITSHSITPRPADQALYGLKTYGIGTDAAVVIRNSPWSLIRLPISLDTGGQSFTTTGSIANAMTGIHIAEPGHGFILINSLPLMDEPGEWYFDPDSHYLYFYYWNPLDIARSFPEKEPQLGATWFTIDEDPVWSPTNKDPYMNAGIEFVGKHNSDGTPSGAISKININGIRVFTSAGAGIRLKDVLGADIQNVHVSSTTDQGIMINGSTKVNIANSFISNTGNSGIAVGPSFVGVNAVAPVGEITITGNILNKIGRIANQSKIDLMSGIRVAVYLQAVITGNTISNTAYTGISAGEPEKNEEASLNISDNIISSFLGLLNDGGGIYVSGKFKSDEEVIHGNKFISGNTISNPIGNLDGTPATTGFPCSWFGGSEVRMIGAIYLDQEADFYEGHKNTVTGLYEPYSWLVQNGGTHNIFPLNGDNIATSLVYEKDKYPKCRGKNPSKMSAAIRAER